MNKIIFVAAALLVAALFLEPLICKLTGICVFRPPEPDPPIDFEQPEDDVSDGKWNQTKSLNRITFKDFTITPEDDQLLFSFSLQNVLRTSYSDLSLVADISQCIFEAPTDIHHAYRWNGLSSDPSKRVGFSFPTPRGTMVHCIHLAILDQEGQVLGFAIKDIPASSYLYRLLRVTKAFAEDARITFIGQQGIGKSTVINSLIQILSGLSVHKTFAKVEDIEAGVATTLNITTYDREWFENRRLSSEVKGYLESGFEFSDTVGITVDASLFNEALWTKVFLGQHPQPWDIENDKADDPSVWINKKTHLIVLCIPASILADVEGFIKEVGAEIEKASRTTGGKMIVAVTMLDKVIGSYDISPEEMEEQLVLARKASKNSIVLMGYDNNREADWRIDFQNLKMLIHIANIAPVEKDTGGFSWF